MSRFFHIDLDPAGYDWDNWSAGVSYVLGSQGLPTVEEKDWRVFARDFASDPYFEAFAVSDPQTYKNWREWAEELLVAANGRFNRNI